jgi:hypothetical protein
MTSRLDGWDEHLAGFPEATFYHTRLWARILAEAYPELLDESRWIESAGARAALPLQTWRRLGGLLTTRHSSFPFLYGGPVPRRIGDRDLLADALGELGRGRRSLVCVSNPYAPGACETLPAVTATHDATHLLELPSRHEEFWDNVLTTAKRNDVRRLTKKGVSIRLGGTAEEIATVYGFYRRSFERWGGTPGHVYPRALYHAMIERGEGNVRLYLAEYEERIIGGTFVVRWNGHAHYHAGYFDHEARSLRPNVLLQERIIRDAIEDGLRDYDFLPSGGNRGVEEFKESFGGKRTELQRYEYRAMLHRLVGAVRRDRR